MSQCIIVCAVCEREILSIDNIQRTSAGRIVCGECAEEYYMDVPLN